jgi:plasmid stabilization system protein ParE
MKVILEAAAYADLERIHAWIAADRPNAARSVVERILDAAERLGSFPEIGRLGRVTGTREWVVRGLPYIIVYRVDRDLGAVVVHAVFHGAQDR